MILSIDIENFKGVLKIQQPNRLLPVCVRVQRFRCDQQSGMQRVILVMIKQKCKLFHRIAITTGTVFAYSPKNF